jgi:basic amino acid/polyamine antiporter, APA family
VVVITVAIAGLAGFSFWGLPHISLSHLTPFAPHGVSGIFSAALVAFLSFGGFDMVAAGGEEIKQPERNLPRAILLTLVGILVLYLIVAFVAVGTVASDRLGSSASPLADAANFFGGTAARHLVVFCALLATAAPAKAILVVTVPHRFRDGARPAAAGAARRGRRPDRRPVDRCHDQWSAVPLALAGSAGLLVASGVTGMTIGSAWLLVGVVRYTAYLFGRRSRRAERTG